MRILLLLCLMLGHGVARAETMIEYHIRLQTNQIQATTELHLMAAYFRDKTIPLPANTNQPMLHIYGFDHKGQTVYEQLQPDPRWLHAEVFSPDNGSLIEQKTILQADTLLRVNIPQRLQVQRLAVSFNDQAAASTTGNIPLYLELDQILPAASGLPEFEQLAAQGVYPVLFSGDPANRVDLVVVAEGYSQQSLGRFEADVATIIQGYFADNVYQHYQQHFNVWRVEVASQQNGTGYGAPVNTRFRSYFNCYNIARLLCVNESMVLQYLYSILPATAIDKVLVVVNSTQYGGAGGQVATISLDPAAINLALHELGHSFAGLADEYSYGNCSVHEPASANVSRFANGSKWAHWLPHVSVYQGAMYCSSGMYRPTYNSMMRELGHPFYAVNNEAIVRRIYAFVDPIEQVLPAAGELTLVAGSSRHFRVEQLNTADNSVRLSWYLNGQLVSTASEWTFDGNAYPEGGYQLSVQVKDETSYVRNDPQQRLQSSRTWQIRHGQSCTVPAQATRLTVSGVHSRGFRLSWAAVSNASSYNVEYWNSVSGQWLLSRTVTDNTATYNNSASGSTFYLRVIASNSCGSAPASAYVTVRLP